MFRKRAAKDAPADDVKSSEKNEGGKGKEEKDDKPTRKRVDRSAWSPEQIAIHEWQWAMAGPVVATSLTWLGGVCSHGIALLDDAPFWTGVAAAGGAVIVSWVVRMANKKRWVRRWSMRYWLSAAVSGVWMAITTWAG